MLMLLQTQKIKVDVKNVQTIWY